MIYAGGAKTVPETRALIDDLMRHVAEYPRRYRAAIIALDVLLELDADVRLAPFDTDWPHGPELA